MRNSAIHASQLPGSGLLRKLKYAVLDTTSSSSSHRMDGDGILIKRALWNTHRKEIGAKFNRVPNSAKVRSQGHTVGVIPELRVLQTNGKCLVGVVSNSRVDVGRIVLKENSELIVV